MATAFPATGPTDRADRSPYLWFAVALVLSIFASGRITVPVLAWLAPLVPLRLTPTVWPGWLCYVRIPPTSLAALGVGGRVCTPLRSPGAGWVGAC